MSRAVTTPAISERVVSMSGVVGGDQHLLGHAADLEEEMQRQASADADQHVLADGALEALQLRAHVVAAGRQQRNHVVAFAVGQRAAHESRVAVLGRDGHPGHNRPSGSLRRGL